VDTNLLTIASYNIHGGLGLNRRRDLDRIAAVIQEIQPDVIGLQEVIRADGAAHADQPAYLASKLSMTAVMGVTRPHGGAAFGNAVLTRLPLVGSTTYDLSHRRYEPRGCLRVDLAIDGASLHVFNCHFGLRFGERREQLALLADLLSVTVGVEGPRVLMGDFNEWHLGPISRVLRRQFPSRARMRRTYPAVFPLLALDRIYWDQDLEGQRFRVHRSRRSRVASDHLPVVAQLSVRRDAGAADLLDDEAVRSDQASPRTVPTV